MGIYREWTDRHDSLNYGREALGPWIMRQAELDRKHYAQVENNHSIALEAALSDSDYFKKEAKANALALDDAREKRDDAMKHEDAANRLYQACLIDLGISNRQRDEARQGVDKWADRAIQIAKERDEARAEIVNLKTGNKDLADVAAELAEAKDSAKFWEDRFDVCAGQLKKAEAERDEAENYTNRIRLDRDRFIAERDKAREALKSRCADGCEKTLSNLYRAGIERDEARCEAGRWKLNHGTAVKQRDEARSERDEAKAYQVHLQRGWGTANAAIDEARAEIVNLKTVLKLTQNQLIERNNELLAGRMPYHHADGTPCTPKRPTGRIEALESRVSNLEAQSNAKQADEALDSLKVAR